MTYEEALYQINNWGLDDEKSPEELRKAAEVFRKAIKKQIPMRPTNKSGYYADNHCPCCGSRIKSGEGSSSRYRNYWCNHCGQAIDWGD